MFVSTNIECFSDMLKCVCERVLFAGVLCHQVIPPSSANYLVVYICDIHDVDDIIVEVGAENTTQDVKGDVGAGMAHVRGIVDCRPTAVPENSTTTERDKLLLQKEWWGKELDIRNNDL